MKKLNNFTLFSLTSLGVFIILELYIRFSAIEAPSNTDIDPKIGRVRKPNAEFVFFNEGFAMGRFNNYGFLGEDIELKKPDSVYRIALLGDSYVEGLYALGYQHFSYHLKNGLDKLLPGKKVEILNFGRSGFDLSDMYAYDNNFAMKFQPDLTVYFLSKYDLLPINKDPLVPQVRLNQDEIVIDTTFRNTSKYKLFNTIKPVLHNSATLQLIRNSINLISSGKYEKILLDKLYAASPDTTDILKNQLADSIIFQQSVSQAILRELNSRESVLFINRDYVSWSPELLAWSGIEPSRYNDMSSLFTDLMRNGIDPAYWEATNQNGHWNLKVQERVGQFLMKKIITESTEKHELAG